MPRPPSPAGLVGNALCLDFVNTVDRWPDPSRDELDTPESLRSWLEQTGLPVAGDPAYELPELRALRALILGVFGRVADKQEPAAAELGALLRLSLAEVGDVPWTYDRGRTRLSPDWPPIRGHRDLQARLGHSSLTLLRRGPLDRVGRCPGCGWLFLDVSRNGSRRWCSMTTCGGREKSATYLRKAASRR